MPAAVAGAWWRNLLDSPARSDTCGCVSSAETALQTIAQSDTWGCWGFFLLAEYSFQSASKPMSCLVPGLFLRLVYLARSATGSWRCMRLAALEGFNMLKFLWVASLYPQVHLLVILLVSED